MGREVNTVLLTKWIESKGSGGIRRLSLRANVSVTTVARALSGRAPSEIYRRRLAQAIDTTEDILFPLTEAAQLAS